MRGTAWLVGLPLMPYVWNPEGKMRLDREEEERVLVDSPRSRVLVAVIESSAGRRLAETRGARLRGTPFRERTRRRGAVTFLAFLLGMLGLSRETVAQCPASPPLLTALTGPFALSSTNGNKVVSQSTTSELHRVHEDGNRIYYCSSLDGLNWSSPQEIGVPAAPGSIAPTIAITSGVVGVVFVRGPAAGSKEGDLYYTFKKTTGGAWSTPVHIGWGGSPAMKGLGGQMHLVSTGGIAVWYQRFPSSQPPTTPGVGEEVGVHVTCAVGQSSFPSIAVSQQTQCAVDPVRVRVAYFAYHDCTACGVPDPFNFNLFVYERDSAATYPNPWYDPPLYVHGGPVTSGSQVGAVSLSLDGNDRTGTTVLAYSYANSVSGDSTRLVRITRNGQVTAHDLGASAGRTIVDVEVRDVHCDGGVAFRHVFTPIVSGGGSHVSTWSIPGTWFDGMAQPTWGQQVQLASAARDAQAIFWARPASGGQYRTIRAVFERQTGSSYGLETDHALCPSYPLGIVGLSCTYPCPLSLPISYYAVW